MTGGNSQIVLAVYIITFVTGMPANILALYTFVRKVRQSPTPLDILLLNLTISDVVFLIFLPFRIKEASDDLKWNMPFFLCPLSGYIFYSTIYNSTFFLTGIAVERYLGVAYPIQYKLKRKPLYAVIYSVFAWVISFTHCSIVYIMQYYDHVNQTAINPSARDTCYEEFSDAQLAILLPVRLELCIVLFCIPLLICFFCYMNLLRLLLKLPNITPRKRFRAVGLAIGTMLMFIVCFGPYNVSHVVGYVNWASPPWRKHALLTSTFNACLDPFIYYFSSSVLRGTFNHLLKQVTGRLHLRCCCRAFYCPLLNCSRTEESTQSSNDSSARQGAWD
ncbi:free fatty acid receptor 2 [Denticeps clupeoides]|uniref:free fatty acid receptor 2 n=1 Tax=Denticeps clupeoides TaxID=299321 RepID=UPI0010A3D71C|nr:free fatty acid receptor 2-like [Denticeps clupeoides]